MPNFHCRSEDVNRAKWDLDTADRAVLREPDFLGDIDKKVVVGVNAERECDRESEDSFELSH